MDSGDRLGDQLRLAVDAYIATLTPIQKTFIYPQQRIDFMKVQGNVWVPQVKYINTTPQTLASLPPYTIYIVTVGTNNIVFNLENAADCEGCIIEFYVVDTNTGKVSLDGYSSQTVGGVSTFELWGISGNSVKLISDGSNWLNLTPKTWKYVADPVVGTNWFVQFTSWGGVNNFSSYGQVIDWSSYLPLGTDRVMFNFNCGSAQGWTAFRAFGDTRILNAPLAGPNYEFANCVYTLISGGGASADPIEAPVDLATRKTDCVACSSTSQDIYASYPIGYRQ